MEAGRPAMSSRTLREERRELIKGMVSSKRRDCERQDGGGESRDGYKERGTGAASSKMGSGLGFHFLFNWFSLFFTF